MLNQVQHDAGRTLTEMLNQVQHDSVRLSMTHDDSAWGGHGSGVSVTDGRREQAAAAHRD